MGASSPLWIVPSLGWWSCVLPENRLSKPWGVSQLATLPDGLCINSHLQVSALLEFLSWLTWWWTVTWKYKLNKPFPWQVLLLVMVFHHSNRSTLGGESSLNFNIGLISSFKILGYVLCFLSQIYKIKWRTLNFLYIKKILGIGKNGSMFKSDCYFFRSLKFHPSDPGWGIHSILYF